MQNKKIKELMLLREKSRARREKGMFIVEGRRELGHCADAGYEIRTVFFCPDIIGADEIGAVAEKTSASSPGCNFVEIPAALYDKVSYRETTEGVIAEVHSREHGLDKLKLGKKPLVIVLESVEKPGNLGAVLRSADSAGADAVIVCDPLTDLYNPNVIRSSLGAVFTVGTAVAESGETVSWLKKNGFRILSAQLQDSEYYYDADMTGSTAIIMGTESTGLTDIWRQAADAHIRIPMLGRLDSLNVSVSAAILLYEAVRQRQSK